MKIKGQKTMKEINILDNPTATGTKAPLVSIVMPTYNVEEYLPDTLDGLTKQTFTDFEILFVDDGSTDKTVSMLQNFAAKDSRATVLQQAHQYAGAARNLGIRHARGKYILFLDGDDFFWPQMLEKSVEKAERTDADICVFRTNRIDYETGKISAMPWIMRIEHCSNADGFSIRTNAQRIFEFTTAAPWNKLYRSDFIKKNGLTFQETRQSNDIAFVCTSLALASKICVINEDLQTHRFNNKKSLQGTNDKRPECFYEALQELKNRLVKYGVYEQAKPAFLNYVVNVSFYNLMTLKNVFSFEKIFYLIRNEIFKRFGVEDKPDDYFYGYYRLAEIRNDLLSLSVYDFFQKWSVRRNREPEDFYERTAVAVAEKGGFMESDMQTEISMKFKGKVYAACNEYDFIWDLIGDNLEMMQQFAAQVAKSRFDNYRFILERIADECKLNFLIRFAQDFRKIRDAGELYGELFSDKDWKTLTHTMEDPAQYYLSTYYHAQFSPDADGRNRQSFGALLRKKISRKVYGLFLCIDEHGYVYTGRRILEHCGINMGTPDFKRKHK